MSCGCNSPSMINSWIDWRNTSPQNPLDLIAQATLNNLIGVYDLSTDYAPSTAWEPNGWSLNGPPVCQALETDNLQMVADAAQWNFQHQTQVPFTDPAPPLEKVIFLRGGTRWKMTIPITLDADCEDIQLSFRDNAGTRGDAQGAIPVILWSGVTPAGTYNLDVTLTTMGPSRAVMGIKATYQALGKPTMYESEWLIVP